MRDDGHDPYAPPLKPAAVSVSDSLGRGALWVSLTLIAMILVASLVVGLLTVLVFWVSNHFYARELRERLFTPWALPLWPVPVWVTAAQLVLLVLFAGWAGFPLLWTAVPLWALGVPGVNWAARVLRRRRTRVDGFDDLGL